MGHFVKSMCAHIYTHARIYFIYIGSIAASQTEIPILTGSSQGLRICLMPNQEHNQTWLNQN